MAVLWLFLQQITVFAHINGGGGYDFFTYRINGRVRYLRKHLLKVTKQRLVFLGQYGKRRIHTHGADVLGTIQCHAADAVMVFFVGVAECLLQTGALLRCVGRYHLVGNF